MVVKASTPLRRYEPGRWGPAEAAYIAQMAAPRPVTSSRVAFSGRELTGRGQFVHPNCGAHFYQKIDEGTDLQG